MLWLTNSPLCVNTEGGVRQDAGEKSDCVVFEKFRRLYLSVFESQIAVLC